VSSRPRRLRGAAPVLAAAALAGGCTPVVRYTDDLVSDRGGRTWFTQVPATVGGSFGFVLGVPIDIVASPVLLLAYVSQPRETRDPLSVFLFPSFVLLKVGMLVGAPFDAVEWVFYRAWLPEPVLTQEEREAIEREWDTIQYFTEFPVTPIHPAPRTEPDGDGDGVGPQSPP
jgi:hypothetical protein